jgi:hypothetical protein
MNRERARRMFVIPCSSSRRVLLALFTGAACFAAIACSSTTPGRSRGDSGAPEAEPEEEQNPPADAGPIKRDAALPPGSPGQRCTKDGDCLGGSRAVCATELPGGYCVVTGCTKGGSDCPAHSFCVASSAGNTYCVEGPCSQDSDCSRASEGYHCDVDRTCAPK